MNNLILEYLEAYKSLDMLCRQVLESDRGVSEYIDEMSNERQGEMLVAGWEKDYKQLKRLRWIRNQLVHDVNSFQNNLIDARDVEWLKTFQSRIMEHTLEPGKSGYDLVRNSSTWNLICYHVLGNLSSIGIETCCRGSTGYSE